MFTKLFLETKDYNDLKLDDNDWVLPEVFTNWKEYYIHLYNHSKPLFVYVNDQLMFETLNLGEEIINIVKKLKEIYGQYVIMIFKQQYKDKVVAIVTDRIYFRSPPHIVSHYLYSVYIYNNAYDDKDIINGYLTMINLCYARNFLVDHGLENI